MLSNNQVISYITNKGLDYKIRQNSATSGGSSTWFCVYDKAGKPALEYNPFTNWLLDCRTQKKTHDDTVTKFKNMCSMLSEE